MTADLQSKKFLIGSQLKNAPPSHVSSLDKKGVTKLSHKSKFSHRHALSLALFCSAALTSIVLSLPQAAFAADSDPSSQIDTTNQGPTEVKAVIVTGTRIPSPNLMSAAPVSVIGNAEIKFQGATRTEDLLNNLPQVFASQGSTISNGSVGTATVNLRNLGEDRTVVLIDGKRLQSGDPQYPAGDLNMIPDTLIDHVEVLTGGASATYGADAVAGVVNFIMKKRFEGLTIDAQHSFYNHENNSNGMKSLIGSAGFVVPPSNVSDGGIDTLSLALGVNAPDDKGNISIYMTYANQKPIIQKNRDYSACTLKLNDSNQFKCGGSATTSPTYFETLDAGGNAVGDFIIDKSGPGNTLRNENDATDLYNYGATNYFQRSDQRYNLGMFGEYAYNKHYDLYGSFMFMDDHTVAQIAPSGTFGNIFNIPCSNPYLSGDEFAKLCTAIGLDASGTTGPVVFRRNVEGGSRQDDLRHTDYRIVIGLKGEITQDFRYDVSGQYGSTNLSERYKNDLSYSHVANALNVTTDSNGNPVCAGTDAACVPYNIFQIGGVTPAALAYISVPAFSNGEAVQQIVSGSVTGDLTHYGVISPYAIDGIRFALGSEYRRESLSYNVDNEYATGDLMGQGGPIKSNSGSYDVFELFGEVDVPLIQNRYLIKNLDFSVGYRHSDYSINVTTDTYRGSLIWRPVESLMLRGSYNRAVRVPSIEDLYLPQSVSLDGSVDPCAGAQDANGLVNGYTQAQCARTGVTADKFGNISANPSTQYNGLQGGNTKLQPEIADTYTYGFVFTPYFIKTLSLSVDYFRIDLQKAIGTIGADTIINSCVQSGSPYYCSLIHRAPGTESLWLGGTAGYISDTKLNTGGYKANGIDFEANYKWFIGKKFGHEWGNLAFNFVGSYYLKLATKPAPGENWYDCAGYYGSECGSLNSTDAIDPAWRHKLRVTWNTPLPVQVSAAWRYIGGVKRGTSLDPIPADLEPDARIAAVSYFDLAAEWEIKDNYVLRFGINNLFDKDPPLAQGLNSGQLNGNTFPQVYDALGRYLFAGITASF